MTRMATETPPTAGPIPNMEEPASLPKKERKSATKIVEWVQKQIEKGLERRRMHALQWIRVISIMRGIHWFTTTGGVWRPIRQKNKSDKQILAKVKLLKPWYARQLGMMNENEVGVVATPLVGQNPESFFNADRAQTVMGTWADEIKLSDYDRHENQLLLKYGGVFRRRYPCMMDQQVKLQAIPQSEVFPIPFDAADADKADGLMWITHVSEQWLEQEDMLFKARYGRKPDKPMAKQASMDTVLLSAKSTTLGTALLTGEKTDGAVAITVWMKPTPFNPFGEYIFILNDMLYRYWSRPEDGIHDPLPNKKIPLDPVYYLKDPDDFWGEGFCEALVPAQREADRQQSVLLRSALMNRDITVFNSRIINPADIQSDEAALVPVNDDGLQQNRFVIERVVGNSINKDTASVFSLTIDNAKRAVGYESGIIFGQSEGRVDSGPPNTMLNRNALAPLQAVVGHKFKSYERTLPAVLDMLPQVWPEDKQLRTQGEYNLGRSLMLKRQQIPSSKDVILKPTPMVAGGKTSMINMLLQLRSMPDDTRQTPIVSDAEFRRSLRMLDVAPPGIRIIDEEEERIRWRIARLIGDTQQPQAKPAGCGDKFVDAQQAMENHEEVLSQMRKAILAPQFDLYSPLVKKVLLAEINWHNDRLQGIVAPPNRFDDDIERLDSQRQERYMFDAYQNLDSDAGQFVPLGA